MDFNLATTYVHIKLHCAPIKTQIELTQGTGCKISRNVNDGVFQHKSTQKHKRFQRLKDETTTKKRRMDTMEIKFSVEIKSLTP